MNRWNYVYAGMRVASEIELPEWSVFESAQSWDDPDVQIHFQVGPITDEPPLITPDQYRFHIPGIANYCVRDGREVFITTEPNAGERETRLFLLGSAWGALCYQRGILALHTSVVQVRESAVAFAGATGAGKSSLAAMLDARGYPLICDDLCCFDLGAGTPRVFPGTPRVKLWRDALTALGQTTDGLERDHFRMDKFHTDLSGYPRPDRSVPLRAVYLLEWGELHIAQFTGVDALRRLIVYGTYRGDLLEPMGLVAAHWERCARVAQHASVYQFTRPQDWTGADAATALLTQHWQNIFDTSKES